ncbi:hypothetical protein LNA02_18930 [Levilactobacillus namurensis]|nr:hypothetical protein LNA02_18930 [Levilactobacillus namurensis]
MADPLDNPLCKNFDGVEGGKPLTALLIIAGLVLKINRQLSRNWVETGWQSTHLTGTWLSDIPTGFPRGSNRA